MKKTTVTTKVVSILLSIVCAGSALGILGTVSTAAAENKSTAQTSVAVATETVNSDQNTVQPTVQPTEKKTNKRNQPFLNDYEKEALEKVYVKSKKVSLQMVKAYLEKMIDNSFGKTAYGAIAVGIKNVMKDLLFEEEKTLSKDTEVIREDLSRLSDQISSNHAEALVILDKLEKKIGVETFKNRLHEVKTDYTYVTGKIDKLGGELEAFSDRVIDEATYNKFKAILKNSEIDSSKLSRNLLSTALDVTPNKQADLDVNDAAAVKAYLEKNNKSALIKYRDYLLSTQRVSNVDCDFNKVIDYNSTVNQINKVNDDVYQTCLMDYTTILTLNCIEYKIAEYEHQGKSDQKVQLDAIMQNINDVSESINRIAQMNAAIKATNNTYAVAKVKVGNIEKTFSNFDEAWATASNASGKAIVTLITDIKGDSSRGVNPSKIAKGVAFNDTNGLKVCKEMILDLNGRTIDLGGKCTGITVMPKANLTVKNGTIKNGGKAFEFTDKKDNDKTSVTIEKVTFDGFKNGGFDIEAGKKFNLNMKNSAIKNVADGRGFSSKEKLYGTIENCVIENCRNKKFAGGMYLNNAEKLTLKNCEFKNNISNILAGALYISGSKAKITGCTFTGNKAYKTNGGAACLYADTVVENCTFTGNSSFKNGGALYVGPGNKLVLNNSKITDNVGQAGAAIYLGTLFSAHHEFKDVTITGNRGVSAVYADSGRKFRWDSADIDLKGTIKIIGNTIENVHLSKRGGKAVLYTTESFNARDSKISVATNQNDAAVVSLKEKAHESAFTALGNLYRGSIHNYTLYLKDKA